MAQRVRDSWTAAGRATITAWAPGLSTPIGIRGYRGDERGSVEWYEWLLAVLPSDTQRSEEAGVLMRGDALLHHGRWDEAADLLARPGKRWSWWGLTYQAVRAEALLRAGRSDEGLLAEIEARALEHAYSRAVALRARGIRDDDEAALREALATFRETECLYQEARTGWLLGGEERAAAERTFQRLRVDPAAT